MSSESDIKWIKSVKRNKGNDWAYLEYHDGSEFYLNWPKKFENNIHEPANGEIIMIFQTVKKSAYKFPGTYLSHLVTPISKEVLMDSKNPLHPWIRKCKVIAYAGLDNLISKPQNFHFTNFAWGDCRKLTSFARNSNIRINQIQKQIWDLFEPEPTRFRKPIDSTPDTELGSYMEGKERELMKKHKYRERSTKFVSDYKFKYKNITKCPACACEPISTYKIDAINFFELHHIEPFSLRKEEYKITDNDVCLLCPNCHRAIHKVMSKYKMKKITIKDFISIISTD